MTWLQGIAILLGNVATRAFHNSWDRLVPPKCHPNTQCHPNIQCHPNTQVAAIQEILDWLDDPESAELVMWLHGARGVGKSAIVLTIAQLLCEQGRLSGSFFFPSGSTPGKDDERKLAPTLAYQLSKFLPETRAHIATAVLNDHAIFDLALLSQVQDLLIDPLQIASDAVSSPPNASPRLFIVDGLAECHTEDVQYYILQVFAAAVESMQHRLPQRILIASRSDIHHLTGFNELDTVICRRLPLDTDYHPDRRFLQDNFAKIRGEHRNTRKLTWLRCPCSNTSP